MALAAALEGLLAEAKCCICPEELKDPVTIDCGHDYCRSCICPEELKGPVTIDCGHNYCRSCMEECRKEEREEHPWPICRHRCTEEILSSNAQLEKIIDLAKQLQSSRRKKRRKKPVRTVCEKRNVILSQFCDTDSELLCSQCTGHSDHPVLPRAEAARRHRENLRKLVNRRAPWPLQLPQISKKPDSLFDLSRLLATIVWEPHF